MSSTTEYLEFRQHGGIADLSERVKLRLTGADRVRYLNGQITADVRKLTGGRTVPACVVTAKGKLCADIFVTAADNALLLDADASLGAALPARLERYIIADDVTLEDLTQSMRLIHLVGTASAEMPGLIAHGANRFGWPGLDLLLDPAQFDELWPRLTASHVVLDDPLSELLRIEAGLPRWGRELTEDTLPPEAGLDRTHIDYHKGCYIGQEVISRIKSVGHVNRTLTGFVSLDGASLSPGAALFASGAESAKPLGTLTSTAWSFALEQPIALGYLKRGSPTDRLVARTADPNLPDAFVATHPLPFTA